MISYNESQNILRQIAESFTGTSTEVVELNQSVGRILAEDLRARENNPPFDNSAMDGFAVNTAAINSVTKSGTDWLIVHGLIGAGDTDFKESDPQGPVEIMTGAAIPSSYFDSVIRIEDVEVQVNDEGQKKIKIRSQPRVGDNIRLMGEDTVAGDLLLSQGTVLTCQHLLVLATQGISHLIVQKRLQIAVVSTGKEIVDYHTKELKFGQIRNSTGIYLESVMKDNRLHVKNFGIVEDDSSSYLKKVKTIFDEGVELLVSTGAVSMGVYDFVRPALESIGAKIHFHKCAIRPGKPILFASLVYKEKMRFIFGVPGNPISTLVGYKFFIKPFIDGLLRGESEMPQIASLTTDIKKPEGMKCFFKARLSHDGPVP